MKPTSYTTMFKPLFRQIKKLVRGTKTYNQVKENVIGWFKKHDYRRLPYQDCSDPKFPGLKSLSDLDTTKITSRSLYKYVSEDALRNIIASNGGIRFCEPTQWNDKYESIFYRSEKFLSEDLRQKKIYASCFTTKKENEAAWKAYLSSDSGDLKSALSFRLEISRSKMINALLKQFGDCELYEAPVAYLHKNQVFSSLDSNRPRIRGFSQGTFRKGGVTDWNAYISLLSVKRDYFSYEDEARYFILPGDGDTSGSDNYKYLLNPITYIKKITVVRPYGQLSMEPCAGSTFELTREELDFCAGELGIEPSLLESYNPYKFADER